MSEKAGKGISSASVDMAQGIRKNGKQWHERRAPFRPMAGMVAWSKRMEDRKAREAMKAKEKEMKEEKEAERQKRTQAIREKRATKEEKDRYEKMAAKMHQKRVDRLKRKEKRNKMLHS
ncbi:MAG: hypothetical protein M1826_000579 [Phylliscum demangeonii]|nr:MAG: hypothetical protein M1826_000579 [Phylliscum demangeonii]